MTALSQQPLSDFASEWERCKPWIEAALEYDGGLHTISEIEDAIATGEAQFWPGKQSAGVTQFRETPRVKALHLWLAGGDMDELLNGMRPDIEAWGASQGCTRVVVAGRGGWVRALKSSGYTPLWTALSKELT